MVLLNPGLPRLDLGLSVVGLGVHGGDAGMVAEFGRPDPFEAEEVKLDGGPLSSQSRVSMTCRMP